MNVLGISCFFHDSAASLVRDGVVVAAAEEERFSRRKHDNGFPAGAAAYCLEQAGIATGDLDHVVYYERPGLKLDRVGKSFVRSLPKSWAIFPDIVRSWHRDKLWVSDIIAERIGIGRDRILFSEHHFSHACAAYHCSPFDEAAILTLDGVGEWVTAQSGVFSGIDYRRDAVVNFPHSLGLLYSAFAEFLGFEVNEGEFKVMGMSSYGEPRFVDAVEKLFLRRGPRGFELDLDYFAFLHSGGTNLSPRFVDLFGAPRRPEAPFFLDRFRDTLADPALEADPQVAADSQRYADIAASVQRVVEDQIVSMATALRRDSGSENLCLGGGVAYNCVANGRVIRESGFANVYINPATGDSGSALGAALAVCAAADGRRSPAMLGSAYLGKEYPAAAIRDELDRHALRYEEVDDDARYVAKISDLLAAGKVVGWFQGRFEFGPRALGARSILADPRRRETTVRVNQSVKYRELFRPFAPVVTAERAADYFGFADGEERQLPYRFMLGVTHVREAWRDGLQAVTHVDGTARVQVLPREANPKLHALLQGFGAKTGVEVLLNTSFNRRGEVLVASPEDCLKTFLWSGIDVLAIGSFIVVKS